MVEDEREANEAGCNDFIAKPVKHQKLLSVIGKYLTDNLFFSLSLG